MSAVLTIGHNHPQGPAIVRGALTALWKVWTAYALKRAISDVASTSDQDYRDFGLDKAEILAALRRLRDEIEDGGTLVARDRARHCNGRQLAIVVAKGVPGVPVRP